MVKELIIQTIQFLVLFVLFMLQKSNLVSNEMFFTSIIVLGSYLIFILIGSLKKLFRPITIEVLQHSELGEGIKSSLILTKNNKVVSDESQRSVVLCLNVKRRGSIWWWLLKLMIKNKDLTVNFEVLPKEAQIQAEDELMINEINVLNKYGFSITLNDLIEDLRNSNGSFVIKKEYKYHIKKHEEITVPSRATMVVQPVLRLNGKNSVLTNLIIQFETNSHLLEFYNKKGL